MRFPAFTVFFLCAQTEAAWYYDQASCGSSSSHIQALATDGIPNAMALIQGASTAFGDAAAAGGVWSFPNTEARDLAGKIFGKVSSPPDYYAAVKTGFSYLLNNYQHPGGAMSSSPPSIGSGDVLFYCDLKRFPNKPTQDALGEDERISTIDPQEKWKEDDFQSCNWNSVTAGTIAQATMANTDISGPRYAIIQICPWYLKQAEARQQNSVAKIARYWYYKMLTGTANLVLKHYYKKPPTQIDLIALFDTTLVHELTHAIQPSGQPGQLTRTVSTTDVGDGSYGWNNIYGMRNNNPGGTSNADSWAYFALGTQQLTQGNQINADGTMSPLPAAVNFGINNNVVVDATWTPTRKIKARGDHSHRESYRSQARDIKIRNRQLNSGISGAPSGGLSPTGPNATSLSLTPISQSLTITYSSSKPGSTNSSSSSNGSNASSGSASSTPTPRSSGSLSSSESSAFLAGASSTLVSTSGISFSSPPSSGGNATLASASTSSKSSTSISSALPSVSSAASSGAGSTSSDAEAWIWSVTAPTAAPSSTVSIPGVWTGFTPTTSTESIASTTTDTALYIPSITNLAAFPTVNLKNPDPKDKNQDPVPFVKVNLPKDKCNPLPKVKGGGLLGLGFKLASSVVNGVLDSACHLVFPVVKGTIPPWVALDIYPPVGDFPPDPDNPTDNPSNSQGSSTQASSTQKVSSSSSSSCSATGIPQCTASCAPTTVGGTQTSSCSQVCTTVSQCSGTRSTSTISGSASGLPVSLIEHDAPDNEWFDDQASFLAQLIQDVPTTLPGSLISASVTANVSGSISSASSASSVSSNGAPNTAMTSKSSSANTPSTSVSSPSMNSTSTSTVASQTSSSNVLTSSSSSTSQTTPPPAPITPILPPVHTVTAAPSFVHGTCTMHIFEETSASGPPALITGNITIHDGSGALWNPVIELQNVKWGEATTITKTQLPDLPNDIQISFLETDKDPNKRRKNKREEFFKARLEDRLVGGGGQSPHPDWRSWLISFSAGNTKWSYADTSKSTDGKPPYCNVGGWTKGTQINRDSDCLFPC